MTSIYFALATSRTRDKTVKAFMLLFTAFQTASMSARFVTEAIKRELKADNSTNLTDDEINSRIGDGYLSMSLLYAVFAMANFFSPSIVKICGHKASMVSYH